MTKNRVLNLLILYFLLSFNLFSQDTITFDNVISVKSHKEIANYLEANKKGNCVVQDYSMTYTYSILLYYFLQDSMLTFYDNTSEFYYWRRIKKCYYKRIHNMDSVTYVGMANEDNPELVVKLLFYFLIKDKVNTNDEIHIYNKLWDLREPNDKFPLNEYFDLLENIVYSSSDDIFNNRPLVLSICNAVLNSRKNNLIDYIEDNKEDKIVLLIDVAENSIPLIK